MNCKMRFVAKMNFEDKKVSLLKERKEKKRNKHKYSEQQMNKLIEKVIQSKNLILESTTQNENHPENEGESL